MEKSVLQKVLQDSKENKRIIGLRKYGDDDDFWCGYVHDYSEELVYIQHFTKFGKDDGLIIEKLVNIECIESGDEYSKSYQYIIQNHEKLDNRSTIKLKPVKSENWQNEILKQLSGLDILIKIEINNDYSYTGSIVEFDTETLKISCVGNLGEDEGNSFYKISDITSIQFDRMEERKRLFLSKWRKDNNQ